MAKTKNKRHGKPRGMNYAACRGAEKPSTPLSWTQPRCC